MQYVGSGMVCTMMGVSDHQDLDGKLFFMILGSFDHYLDVSRTEYSLQQLSHVCCRAVGMLG